MNPKDKVFVKSLNREGEILEKLKSGLYRVVVGTMQVDRPEKDLKILDQKAWSKYQKITKPKVELKADPLSQRAASRPLDLHGMRVEEALRELSVKLDEAILADLESIEVVHGLGTGALLAAVHEFLKKQPTVKNFKLMQNNPGTTIVYF